MWTGRQDKNYFLKDSGKVVAGISGTEIAYMFLENVSKIYFHPVHIGLIQ